MEDKLEMVHSLARSRGDSRHEIDIIGTALWNTCGNVAIMRSDSREDQKVLSRGVFLCLFCVDEREDSLTLTLVKTIAFILIDAVAPNTVSGIPLPISTQRVMSDWYHRQSSWIESGIFGSPLLHRYFFQACDVFCLGLTEIQRTDS